jgi:hypothetical protein
MKQGRRGFLKLFGVSSAAIAIAPSVANAEPSVEVVMAPIQEPAPLSGVFLQPTRDYRHGLDVQSGSLYSRLRIEPNSMLSRYQLFQEGMGEGCTLADTNMHIPGALIQPEMYCIKQIGFVFSPKTIPGLRSAFIDRYALSLHLGRKQYWEAPLSTVFSVGEPDRDEKGFATLPDAGFATLEIPLVIEAGLYFSLDLIGKPIHPCGKITGWGVFKGLHARGIQ